MPISLFVRQPLTRSGPADQALVQLVLDVLSREPDVHLLTGDRAESDATFRCSFEQVTGTTFTPQAFRQHRMALLDRADAMVVVRTGLSESGAFELAYNVFGRRVPVLVAVHTTAPITTTLLRDLQDLCPVRYVTFDNPDELALPFTDFLGALDVATTADLIPRAAPPAGERSPAPPG